LEFNGFGLAIHLNGAWLALVEYVGSYYKR